MIENIVAPKNSCLSPYLATSLLLMGLAQLVLDFTTLQVRYQAQWLDLLIEFFSITLFYYSHLTLKLSNFIIA